MDGVEGFLNLSHLSHQNFTLFVGHGFPSFGFGQPFLGRCFAKALPTRDDQSPLSLRRCSFGPVFAASFVFFIIGLIDYPQGAYFLLVVCQQFVENTARMGRASLPLLKHHA
ncbi:MAG: hypothetical protein AB7O31_00950 [Burkholderiales bacterium]